MARRRPLKSSSQAKGQVPDITCAPATTETKSNSLFCQDAQKLQSYRATPCERAAAQRSVEHLPGCFEDDALVAHVVVSPVTLSLGDTHRYGPGPLSVRPDRQENRIGSAQMNAALTQLQRIGSAGCVHQGDPDY